MASKHSKHSLVKNKPDDFDGFITHCQQRVNQSLEHFLPAAKTHPAVLHEAMRYAVLSGGKRIRPLLVFAAGRAVQALEPALDAAAAAIECIHAYSLVHDDLPAMDDDDLRRGKPTCHKVFDEAQAILAGDALQTKAFGILSHEDMGALQAHQRIRMIELLAQASGSRGMAGGQSIDLSSVGKQLDIAELEDMHIHKTGALIRASVLLGALCAVEIRENDYKALDHYGRYTGLAFQVQDDILDVTSSTEELGKQSGADRALNKPTYPALLGLNGARERARELHSAALDALDPLGESAQLLRDISGHLMGRTR